MNRLFKSVYRHTFKKLFPNTGNIIEFILRTELKGCCSVLDLGCGPSSPLKKIKNDQAFQLYSVGVDIFEPYILNNLVQEKIHSEYINADIFSIDFPPQSFDCALLIDVIEHLNKKDFLAFLPKLEKIAKKIIIITPNGFIEQEAYDGNNHQAHRSGWTVDDFLNSGFSCRGLSGWKFLRGKKWQSKIRPVWLGEAFSDFTQPFVSSFPRLAYHIVAIKSSGKFYG